MPRPAPYSYSRYIYYSFVDLLNRGGGRGGDARRGNQRGNNRGGDRGDHGRIQCNHGRDGGGDRGAPSRHRGDRGGSCDAVRVHLLLGPGLRLASGLGLGLTLTLSLTLTLALALTLTLTKTRNVLPFAASQSCANPSSSQTGETFALRSPSLAAIPAAAPPRDAHRDAFDKYYEYDIDTNHSGKLDHKALCSALEAVGLKKTSAQAAALLAKYGKHQSGLIEFDEFQQLCTALEAVNYNLAGDA
eukprot:scaffold29127_cov78-Phaeocystis_antarctica.AAC.3